MVLLAVLAVGSVTGWIVFRAKAYSELMPMEEGDSRRKCGDRLGPDPDADADSANNLANRKLGELSDLVSQFTVDDASAQINYNGRPVRVNYLNYSGFFKWWNNQSEGIPAYIMIDMRTQEVKWSGWRNGSGIRLRVSQPGSEPSSSLPVSDLHV